MESPRRGRIKKKKISKTKRANILFPVSRIARYLKDGNYAKRVGETAPVFLAAAMEYVCSEVLDLAGTVASDLKKKTINPRHIFLAVNNDEELEVLFRGVTIPRGGAVPCIHKLLLPQRATTSEFESPTSESKSSSSESEPP